MPADPPTETHVPRPSVFDLLYPKRHNELPVERMYAPQKAASNRPPKNPTIHRFYTDDGVRNSAEALRKGNAA